MDIFKRYIDQQKDQFAHLLDQPAKDATLFVVIPCFNEPDILTTLNSLAECFPPKRTVSVLIVVNDSETSVVEAVIQNKNTLDSIENWQLENPGIFLNINRIYAGSLPKKWAGVGWARKIGMDEVIRQITNSGLTEAIIVSLDADSRVSRNYLQNIGEAFDKNPGFNFFTINFEHPIEIQELNSREREGIIRYELHMRFYRNAMSWCGYPHAIHTVGSSFALKASSYVKQGGMNRRQAGEDFYFLHKLVLLGRYGNITNGTVFPASRMSDRVPFGTGAAMKKWIDGNDELYTTYSLEAFDNLKQLFLNISSLWDMNEVELANFFDSLDPLLAEFCNKSGTFNQLAELKKNCSGTNIYQQRTFHLLNAFWILKYLNFAHESSLPRQDLQMESIRLLHNLGIPVPTDISLETLLSIYRKLDVNAVVNY